MKKLLPLFMMLLGSVALAQTATVAQLQAKAKSEKLKDIYIAYDKFKDKSFIVTKPENLMSSWEGAKGIVAAGMGGPGSGTHQTMLLIEVRYEFNGDKLTETPNEFMVLFTSTSHGFVYLKGDKNLYIIADGQRIELHPVATDADVNLTTNSMGPIAETFGFYVPRSDLEKLVNAKSVEFKLGDTAPRKWKPEWSKRVQALLTVTKL